MKSPFRLLAITFVLLLPLAVSAQNPGTQIFVSISGIPGNAGVDGHETEIAALTASFGTNQIGLATAGSAASAAKSQFSTLTIQKLVDKASPMLFIDSALGKLIPSAKITFRSTLTSGPVDNFVVTLSNVYISSYHVDASAGDNGIAETVGLSYNTIKISYAPVDPNGTLQTPITAIFNVLTNKQLLGP